MGASRARCSPWENCLTFDAGVWASGIFSFRVNGVNSSCSRPIAIFSPGLIFLNAKIYDDEKMASEEDMFRALADGEFRLPPLTLRLVEREPKLKRLSGDKYRPDAVVEMSKRARKWTFLVELKAASTAKGLENALAAIQPAAAKAGLRPLILLPYLSPANLARLEDEGVSGIDLCGNGIVTLPDELFVVRTGEPNRFPRSEPIRNVYRGDSSLVARAFLVRPIYRAVGEIVTTVQSAGGDISFPTVSKVLRTLEADLIVARTFGGIRLIQPDKLLQELADNYRPPKAAERYVGKVALPERDLPVAMAEASRQIGARFVLTGAASAARYAVFAREPVVAAYCEVSPAKLLAALDVPIEETDRFPNVDLVTTYDRRPYFDSAVEDGVTYASPVQAYLELMAGDKRQRESAAQVRDRVVRRITDYREEP